MYQKLTIIGNLGRDPDMRFTPDGKPKVQADAGTYEAWKSRMKKAVS